MRIKLGMDPEEMEYSKPEWARDLPYTILVGKNEKGEPQWLNLAYHFPFGSWKTGFIDWDSMQNTLKNPALLGTVLSVWNNYDPWIEARIYLPGDSPKRKWEKIGLYTLKSAGPGVITDVERIIKTIEGETIYHPFPRPRSIKDEVLKTLAIGIYPGGKKDVYYEIDKIQQEISDLMQEQFRIIRKYPNMTEAEKEMDLQETRLLIEEKQKKLESLKQLYDNIQEKEEKLPVIPTEPIFTEDYLRSLTNEELLELMRKRGIR